MSDTRYIDLVNRDVYVLISLDGVQDFSGTNDSNRDVMIDRTDANTARDPEAFPGRPVPANEPIERQAPGFYWARGVGRIAVDDL